LKESVDLDITDVKEITPEFVLKRFEEVVEARGRLPH
jgi:hypothetical protein